jgi:hypothetical protein
MAMRTFYFPTGVSINTPNAIKGVISPNGVIKIPFQCEDVPENAIFKFACDYPNLGPKGSYWVREIHDIPGYTGLLSKYAFFIIP